jgi:hypothetical protein
LAALLHRLVIVWAWSYALDGVARAEPFGPPRFLEGPFDKTTLDHRLEQCPNGSQSIGRRQRRATVDRLLRPFRAAYVTDVFCGDETHQYLVISLGADASFMEQVAAFEKTKPGEPFSRRDPFESLLLRGETSRPQIWLTLVEAQCRRGLWIGVGPSGKPSVIESPKDCPAAPILRRAIVAAPPGLQFP